MTFSQSSAVPGPQRLAARTGITTNLQPHFAPCPSTRISVKYPPLQRGRDSMGHFITIPLLIAADSALLFRAHCFHSLPNPLLTDRETALNRITALLICSNRRVPKRVSYRPYSSSARRAHTNQGGAQLQAPQPKCNGRCLSFSPNKSVSFTYSRL